MSKNGMSLDMIPVNELWDRILFIGLFGIIDSNRAKQVMEAMLDKIIASNSKVIILDILSVPTVDSAVANNLIKICKATKLVGAETIISGISGEIAQTIVELGIELETITTTSNLADAVELAFQRCNYELVEK